MAGELFKTIEEQCSIEALQKFISDVKNVNLKNYSGETALHVVICKWSDRTPRKRRKGVDSKEIESKIVQAVQLLIDAGADVNLKNSDGQSIIKALISCYEGDKLFEILEILIKAGADDVYSKNKYGKTLLHLAVEDKYNQVDFIRFLLKHGVLDVDLQDDKGLSALQCAVQKENKEVVESTASEYALQNQSKEVVECLINAGADITRETPDGYSVLHLAAKTGDRSEFMLNNDIDLEFNDFKKIWQKQKEIVECLVEAGADLNRMTPIGETSLHLAANVVNVALIKYLITRGADVNARSKKGETPLHYLANSDNAHFDNDHLLLLADGLEVLLSANADVNALDLTHGDPPLFDFLCSQYNGMTEPYCELETKLIFKILKIFITYRADFTIKNKYGSTPLDMFLTNCSYFEDCNHPIVLLRNFIKYGIMNVDKLFTTISVERGTTIFHDCCSGLKYKMIKFLVNRGANIEVVDENMETPLIKLIIGFTCADGTSKNRKILDYFLGLNPDVNVISNQGFHILSLDRYDPDVTYSEFVWKALIEYIVKKKSSGYLLHDTIFQTISEKVEYKTYLDKCTEELKSLQMLKFPWMNLHDILMNRKKKLVCYAKNKELVQEFNKLLFAEKYPIYGTYIVKRFSKAVKKLEVMEKSAVILSSCLPCKLDPSHLVIYKIIRYIKVKYLRYLCEPESEDLKNKIKKDEVEISIDKLIGSYCI